MKARLEYDTPDGPQAFDLGTSEITVGRAPDNSLVIHEHSVSRHHARLVQTRDGWHVIDVGSRFGTTVPGRRNAMDPLQDGDVILMGTFTLTFRTDRPAVVQVSATPSPTVDEGTGAMIQPARDFTDLAGTGVGMPRDPLAEIARLKKLLRVLAQASRDVSESESVDALLNHLVDVIFEHLPAERAFVLLWDEKANGLVERLARQRQASSGAVTKPLRVSRTIADKVFHERVAVLTLDAQSDERFRGGESIMAMGIRSAMAAPIWREEQVEGILYVDTPLHVRAFDEHDLDLLSALGNHAATALERARLQESIVGERLTRQRLERYHSPAVVERVTKGGLVGGVLAAEEREVTVLFSDIVGFTSRCERLDAARVAEYLNRCFSRMADVIFRHEGTLDKFIGDCLMAVFGAPYAQADHAMRAVSAAVDIREAIAELNEEMPEEERVQFRTGLNSGKVVAGDIGSVRRSDYTVLGATVNLASRMESSVAKPGQIIITDITNVLVECAFETRFVAEAQPKGISRTVKCYEVVCRKAPPASG